MGHKKGTGRKAEKHKLELERLCQQLVSCPECGTLCRRYTGFAWDGQLFDLIDDQGELAIELLGLTAYLAQGRGVTNGGSHKCPPTWSAMFEADGLVRLEVAPC